MVAIIAPRREPADMIVRHIASHTSMNDSGPEASAATPVTGELRGVLPGRQYQLGATAANPLGVRNVSAVTVKNEAGTTTYAAGTDYNVDLETGRVQILEGGTIVAGKVQFGYTPVAATFESVKSGGKAELTGALRVVSDNAAGGNRDWYLPKVTLTLAAGLDGFKRGGHGRVAKLHLAGDDGAALEDLHAAGLQVDVVVGAGGVGGGAGLVLDGDGADVAHAQRVGSRGAQLVLAAGQHAAQLAGDGGGGGCLGAAVVHGRVGCDVPHDHVGGLAPRGDDGHHALRSP
jgi:hypothetical protein